MSGKFQLKKASNGQFHFNLLAGNGQVILSSEQYKAHASALNGIESVRKNAVREGAFEVKQASNGKHYFVLKATNGQVVGQSQMYASLASAEQGCDSVRRHAPDAALADESLAAAS
ncbi:YegP family protein [Pseudomonas oligotrophica]|uniref:YegP family protein n=1 Tax=Pseudomonas oligotrophica TaxID=2912055 RepID=UPI001F29C4B5|nr:YegP family protein [Pseudomonas oligotrophica]MCF7201343.1 YegP family protein [Pseudomonas oligotrophica]